MFPNVPVLEVCVKQRKPYTAPTMQLLSRPAASIMLKEAAAAGSGEAKLMLDRIEASRSRPSERVRGDIGQPETKIRR